MAKDFTQMEDSNTSSNPSIHDVSSPARRTLLQGGAIASISSLMGCAAISSSNSSTGPKIGFKAIPVGFGDKLVVPEGYTATPIAAWGEPIGIPGSMPAFKPDGSNTAADQAVQMGMHHDGVAFFPINGSSTSGVIAINHEYTDDGLLHVGGFNDMNAEKVKKAQNAHGLSVYEVALKDGQWGMVRPSKYARRIPMSTPFSIGGPAAGHSMMRTAADPAGTTILGTLNNCASSKTPWGTYLSGEENFMFYFGGGDDTNAHQKRWGMRKAGFYQWEKFDARFDAVKNPNESNRFGWVVEVDPMDSTSTPVKRTAMGRAAHEGAWVGVTKDNRAVVYSGEDARFEYIYKFVSRDKIAPGGAKANATLLDHGVLYVARFNADGRGQWLALVHGQGPLTVANGFADQGEVVIKARQASDILQATKMDRPEWLTIHTETGWVYCTLTNNSSRGQKDQVGVDAANPRANNVMGQIIRWKDDGDFDGAGFSWNHLVLAGDPANTRAEAKGNIKGDIYGCPDGITFDQRGVLWIQTDAHATVMYKDEFKNIGSNQMLACDPKTGDTKRFLTGPTNCEITGCAFTPDGTTLFVSVQHPGETPSDRSDPSEPTKYSNWPDFKAGGRPRSATVVIRKNDGGVIGS
jgi:uncharacterized protein